MYFVETRCISPVSLLFMPSYCVKNPHAKTSAKTSARLPDIKYKVYIKSSDILKNIGTDTQPYVLGIFVDFMYILTYSNDASCEFDEFRADTHICKLRTTSIARMLVFVSSINQNLM